jgi:hypothetical protein
MKFQFNPIFKTINTVFKFDPHVETHCMRLGRYLIARVGDACNASLRGGVEFYDVIGYIIFAVKIF